MKRFLATALTALVILGASTIGAGAETTYTLTYIANGVIYEQVEVAAGTTVTLMTTNLPIKPTLLCRGWTLIEGGTTMVKKVKIDADTTVYAVWQAPIWLDYLPGWLGFVKDLPGWAQDIFHYFLFGWIFEIWPAK
ncbi:MAG: InlB B-repeat-containing protein [Oscillospiraceae bacterium]|nr:InlB B-repeat-containing protein [Oscillospiraceae bacterium]